MHPLTDFLDCLSPAQHASARTCKALGWACHSNRHPTCCLPTRNRPTLVRPAEHSWESEKRKTVLELYDLEIHQKKLGTDYHRLKTTVKRSIEQDIRNKNFGARNGNYERDAVVKKPRDNTACTKNLLEIVGNGSPTGSVLEETVAVSATISICVEKWHSRIRLRILSCSRLREKRRGPEVPEQKVPVVQCIDGLARFTTKELAITHTVKSGTLQNAWFYKTMNDCKFWGKMLISSSSGRWTT